MKASSPLAITDTSYDTSHYEDNDYNECNDAQCRPLSFLPSKIIFCVNLSPFWREYPGIIRVTSQGYCIKYVESIPN